MKELKERAQAVINKYTPELSSKGLKILLSKRYFESEVCERHGTPGYPVFNSIERALDRKREKRKYKFVRNKYHTLVITTVPHENDALSKDVCRDYAFVIKKVERAHIGEEPRRVAYMEERILSKIEKRILKILKRADKSSPKRICKDTLLDAIRYTFKSKYAYKKMYVGKERFAWDLILGVGPAVLALVVVVVCWIASK